MSTSELLEQIAKAGCKYRNVSRGYRAEDKTVPLEAMQEEVEQYEAELRLKLFALLDEYEKRPRTRAAASMEEWEVTPEQIKAARSEKLARVTEACETIRAYIANEEPRT